MICPVAVTVSDYSNRLFLNAYTDPVKVSVILVSQCVCNSILCNDLTET